MGVLESAKEVVQLVQKIDNIDLYRQILDLQSEITKLVEENMTLREEVRTLKNVLTLKDSLVFADNGYWIEKAGARDGPFCTHCWDREQKLVRMHQDETKSWYCITHGKPRRAARGFAL